VAQRHPLGWAAIGVAAVVAAVACFLPAFELAIEASIGAGDEQRGFRYTAEWTLAGDLRPAGLLPLAAALALLAAAVAGVLLGSRPLLVAGAFVVACGLGVLVLDTDERTQWAGPGGVIGYEEPNGGLILQPAVDDLQARARRSPEAREPGWELAGENAYSSRGLTGWVVLRWTTIVLLWLTGYRLARLALGVVGSLAAVAAGTLAVLVWIVWRGLSGLG
jgi:hypothetical protein